VRAVIVLPGALGDVIRGLPLAGRLRRGLPDVHLAWVVEPLSAPLLEGHPWLDAVHRLDRRRGLAGFVATAGALRRARYDVALDLGRGAKSAALTAVSGAPRRIGFARADGREGSWLAATERLPPQPAGRSKLEQFLAFAEPLGAAPAPVEFGIAPSAADAATAATLAGDAGAPLVAACVGSSCPSRYWWPARVAAVLDALAERHGARAVLLGTAGDREFARAVAAHAARPAIDLTGRTTLGQLAAVLARARLAFGPDSGALHLAAAVGVPVVSLWGATSAARSAPHGSQRWVVEGRVACAPCFLRECPIDRRCMQAIDVGTVLARAEEALAA
jgi:lipopolysaccharide heptosyltransferase II